LGLPDGKEIVPLAFFVLKQYRRVTDGRTDGQTDGRTDRRVAIAITRASIASQGKKHRVIVDMREFKVVGSGSQAVSGFSSSR